MENGQYDITSKHRGSGFLDGTGWNYLECLRARNGNLREDEALFAKIRAKHPTQVMVESIIPFLNYRGSLLSERCAFKKVASSTALTRCTAWEATDSIRRPFL